jgi:hypothetical protein
MGGGIDINGEHDRDQRRRPALGLLGVRSRFPIAPHDDRLLRSDSPAAIPPGRRAAFLTEVDG